MIFGGTRAPFQEVRPAQGPLLSLQVSRDSGRNLGAPELAAEVHRMHRVGPGDPLRQPRSVGVPRGVSGGRCSCGSSRPGVGPRRARHIGRDLDVLPARRGAPVDVVPGGECLWRPVERDRPVRRHGHGHFLTGGGLAPRCEGRCLVVVGASGEGAAGCCHDRRRTPDRRRNAGPPIAGHRAGEVDVCRHVRCCLCRCLDRGVGVDQFLRCAAVRAPGADNEQTLHGWAVGGDGGEQGRRCCLERRGSVGCVLRRDVVVTARYHERFWTDGRDVRDAVGECCPAACAGVQVAGAALPKQVRVVPAEPLSADVRPDVARCRDHRPGRVGVTEEGSLVRLGLRRPHHTVGFTVETYESDAVHFEGDPVVTRRGEGDVRAGVVRTVGGWRRHDRGKADVLAVHPDPHVPRIRAPDVPELDGLAAEMELDLIGRGINGLGVVRQRRCAAGGCPDEVKVPAG